MRCSGIIQAPRCDPAYPFQKAFKELTADLPLKYLKIRLSRARGLMIREWTKAYLVADAVCYESSSQCSREFKRHFGQSPADVLRYVRAMRMDGRGWVLDLKVGVVAGCRPGCKPRRDKGRPDPIASAHFALPESVSRRYAVAVRNAQRRIRHTGLGGDMGSYLLIRNIALVGQANMQAPSPMQS